MSRLSKGQPITYDFLADLENKINILTRRVNNIDRQNDDDNSNKNVQFVGSMLNGKNITFLAGFRKINVTEGKTIFNEFVKFDTTFAQVPLVTATLYAVQNKDGDSGEMPYATLLITETNRSGFNVKLHMVEGVTTNKDVRINYIAIGRSST